MKLLSHRKFAPTFITYLLVPTVCDILFSRTVGHTQLDASPADYDFSKPMTDIQVCRYTINQRINILTNRVVVWVTRLYNESEHVCE